MLPAEAGHGTFHALTRLMLSQRMLSRLILPVLVQMGASCGGSLDPTDSAIEDDAEFGDSLDERDGKPDGFTVPSSLALNKDGIVYLTFDDGPSPTLTPRILDALERHEVKATFFITGVNIPSNEQIIKRIRDDGHIVANHQWKHVLAKPDDFRSWVTRERDLLIDTAGDMPLYFRYPFGAMKPWKEQILKEEGYTDGGIGWDIDTLDWDFGPDGHASRPEVPAQFRDDFEGWIAHQTERRGGGVILLHDVQSITANHIDNIIVRLKMRGFSFGELPRERRSPVAPGSDKDSGRVELPGAEGSTSVFNPPFNRP